MCYLFLKILKNFYINLRLYWNSSLINHVKSRKLFTTTKFLKILRIFLIHFTGIPLLLSHKKGCKFFAATKVLMILRFSLIQWRFSWNYTLFSYKKGLTFFTATKLLKIWRILHWIAYLIREPTDNFHVWGDRNI